MTLNIHWTEFAEIEINDVFDTRQNSIKLKRN